jgi:hypothetical protein
LLVSRAYVVDPKVEVDLLWGPVRPFRWEMVGRKLDSDPRLTTDRNHVPIFLSSYRPTKHARPELALRGEVGGVEHNDLMVDLHGTILPQPRARRPRRLATWRRRLRHGAGSYAFVGFDDIKLGSIAIGHGQLKMLTAREMTSATVSKEASDWSMNRIFADALRGIVSVGLKAVALV